MKKEERKMKKKKKKELPRCEKGRKKKKERKKKERKGKERKDESGDVGEKLQNFFFFFGVTYSCIFKMQKRSYKLVVAVFLKNAAVGHPKKIYTDRPIAALFVF